MRTSSADLYEDELRMGSIVVVVDSPHSDGWHWQLLDSHCFAEVDGRLSHSIGVQ